mmetsp:Transcript_36747/g.48230  ORF Transcript_36747/g.48230 Transcript_36747/m.48230 type:complete len:93 (+) Transcript_36747:40-318(+)
MDATMRSHITGLNNQLRAIREAVKDGEEHEATRKVVAEGLNGLQAVIRALQTATSKSIEIKDVAAAEEGTIVWGDGTVVDIGEEVTESKLED